MDGGGELIGHVTADMDPYKVLILRRALRLAVKHAKSPEDIEGFVRLYADLGGDEDNLA